MLLGAFALSQLPQLKIQLNIFDAIDPGFESTLQYQEHTKRFPNNRDGLNFTVLRKDGQVLKNQDLCLLKNFLSNELKTAATIYDVLSPWDLRQSVYDPPRLYYPNLIEFNCQSSSAEFNFKAILNSPWNQIVVGPDGKDLSFELSFDMNLESGPYGKFSPEKVDLFVTNFREFQKLNSQFEFHLFGPAAFKWHARNAMEEDSYGNVLIMSLIVIAFKILFNTWTSGLIFLLSSLFTAALTYGGMALLGYPITTLTMGIFLTTCIAGMEDFTFILWLMRSRGWSFQKSAKHIAVPGFITTVTTSIGFGSLYFSDVKMISDFGLWAGTAAFIEWFSIFLFIAAICRYLPQASITKQKKEDSLDHEVKPRYRKVFLTLSSLIFVAGIVSTFFLNYNFNIYYDFPEKHPIRQAVEFFEKTRGWTGSLEVSFPASAQLKEISEFTQLAQTNSNILKIDSAASTLSYLTRSFDQLTTELVQREFKASPQGSRYFADDGTQVAFVFLKNFWLSDIKSTSDDLKSICQKFSCTVLGGPVILLDYSSRVSQTVISSFSLAAFSLGAILLYLCIVYDQLRSFFYLLYSAMWSPVVIVGLMALFQVPINFITSIVVSVIVGLTGDNAIQFIYKARKKSLQRGISESSGASIRFLLMALVPSLAYLSFVLISEKLLGIFLIIGFILCWVGDVLILKSLVEKDSKY